MSHGCRLCGDGAKIAEATYRIRGSSYASVLALHAPDAGDWAWQAVVPPIMTTVAVPVCKSCRRLNVTIISIAVYASRYIGGYVLSTALLSDRLSSPSSPYFALIMIAQRFSLGGQRFSDRRLPAIPFMAHIRAQIAERDASGNSSPPPPTPTP